MQNRFRFRVPFFNNDDKFIGYDYCDMINGINAYNAGTCYKGNIQLSTGIKDVKGNLIYEGDILKVVNGSINGIGLSDKREVKWVGNGWNIRQWSFDCTHSYEVIGNIYQNKELLKEQK